MAKQTPNSYPPRKLPGLVPVKTKQVLIINGKKYTVLKIAREPYYK